MRDRNAYASLRDGLVGAWIPSVSGSGLLLPDLSGNGNNGALTNMGPEDWVAGEYGRALDFDGSNDYVSIQNPNLGQLDFSITGWFKTSSSTRQALVNSYFSTSPIDTGIIADLLNTGNFRFAIAERSGFNLVLCDTNITYNDGVWHFFAARRTGPAAIALTVDETTLTATGIGNANVNTPEMRFGAVPVGYVGYLNGQLDDIRIYNRALSESEIKLLSQEPGVGFKRTRSVFDFGRKPAYLPPTPTDYRTVRVKQTEHASLREGLVGAWCPSIEGNGYTLPDLSGQGNNGTLTNMGPEDWVSSQYGRALDFDGVDDYSTIPMNPIFNMPNVKTITCWVYARAFDGAFQFNDIIATDNIATNDRTWLIGAFDTDNDNVDAELRIASGGTGGGRSIITTSSEVLTNEKWHHIAATTTDGLITVSNVCLHVDGVKQAVTDVSTGTYTAPLPLTSNNPLRFGFRAGTNLDLRWNGQLDDIRIYNRVLSDSEIKLLASRPGIGLRPQRRTMYYAPPTGARRRRILTSMP